MKSDLHSATSVMSHAAERFLNVSSVREVSSAPNSRSCSFKKTHRRPHELGLMEPGCRPRTNSLPSCSRRQRHASDSSGKDRDRLFRVRSVAMVARGMGRGVVVVVVVVIMVMMTVVVVVTVTGRVDCSDVCVCALQTLR